MGQTEPIIANATKTNNLLCESITAEEQDKVSLHHDLSEHQGYDLGKKVRRLFDKFLPVNMDIDLTVYEAGKYQARRTYIFKYSFVICLFNQKFQVPKISDQLWSHSPYQFVKVAHSSNSKRKLDDKNCLNVGNKIFDLVLREKDLPQGYRLWSTNIVTSSHCNNNILKNWG